MSMAPAVGTMRYRTATTPTISSRAGCIIRTATTAMTTDRLTSSPAKREAKTSWCQMTGAAIAASVRRLRS